MNIWRKLAEDKIAKAVEEGVFDNLPGRGKPLALENDSHIAPELKLAYKVLKNAGYVAPEVELMGQINHTSDLLRNAPDEQVRYQAMRRLNYLQMKLGCLRPSSPLLEDTRYLGQLTAKLTKT